MRSMEQTFIFATSPLVTRNRNMKTMALVIGTLLFSLLQTESAVAEESTGFRVTVQPFFAKYCTRCHDAKKQEGEFRPRSEERRGGQEGRPRRPP